MRMIMIIIVNITEQLEAVTISHLIISYRDNRLAAHYNSSRGSFILSFCCFYPAAAVHATMKSALGSLTTERERLKQCLDHETCPPTSPQVVGLKNALATVRETAHTVARTHGR